MKQRLIQLLGLLLAASSHAADLPPETYPGIRDAKGNLPPGLATHLGRDVRVVMRPLDQEMLKRRNNFGYSGAEIEAAFSQPVRMVLDETGLDSSFIKPQPSPGVHPRVLFNPEDLPSIRKRLVDTRAGKSAMDAIRGHLEKMITGRQARFAADYQSLVDGKVVGKIDNDVAYCLMYEAFRCLVDYDRAGGRKVAAAITTFSRTVEAEISANLANPRNAKDLNDARIITQGPSREFTLGLDYDFAYNFMDETQRAATRGVLVKVTAGMTGIGCETLQSLHAGTSNWIPWGSRMLFAICAIEGEPGYDAGTFRRFADAQINFINSIYPSGEAFEGWGKNFMFLEHMVILAKRGKHLDVLGHASVRSAYNNYFVASMTPWGDSFTFCDSMARSGCRIARNADVLMYHTLFPNDACGNFIYRNQISGDYANVGSKTINTRHPFSTMDALCCAIFASDISPVAADEEYAHVTKDRPLTYFSEDTCNMITRSAWDRKALYLNYLNRAVPGGHQYCDRSHFNLYGEGRFWSIYQSSRQIKEQYMPNMRSVLMADGQGPSTAEAKCVAFIDAPLATFQATDLSNPWNFQTAGLVKPASGVAKFQKQHSYNHFRLHPSPLPWMNLPSGLLPHWYSSQKPGAEENADWYQRLDVKKAFRTVGLVRGSRAYSLIVDDLQLDGNPHRYLWGMTLPQDVLLGSVIVTSTAATAAQADIILSESGNPDLTLALPSGKRRHLLVRVLAAGQLSGMPAVVERLSIANPPLPDLSVNRLHVASECVSPGFKMLLFPYSDGDPLPTTVWNADRTVVTIAWADQVDVVTFRAGSDGRTRVSITRNRAELIHLP